MPPSTLSTASPAVGETVISTVSSLLEHLLKVQGGGCQQNDSLADGAGLTGQSYMDSMLREIEGGEVQVHKPSSCMEARRPPNANLLAGFTIPMVYAYPPYQNTIGERPF